MLKKVKTALRILTTELDEELQDMIDACKLDLELTGIVNIDEADPLIIRAAILYAKANFGFSADVNKFQSAYDVLKCSLRLSENYRTNGVMAMFNDGMLEIYRKIPSQTASGAPIDVLELYKRAWFGEIDFSVSEYYADKQAQSKAEKRIRIHQDKTVCNKHVVVITEADDSKTQYNVGRTANTLKDGVPVTNMTLERVTRQYDIK